MLNNAQYNKTSVKKKGEKIELWDRTSISRVSSAFFFWGTIVAVIIYPCKILLTKHIHVIIKYVCCYILIYNVGT